MLPNINQAGRVPAQSGNIREDLKAIAMYLDAMQRQLDLILQEIERELEDLNNGKTA